MMTDSCDDDIGVARILSGVHFFLKKLTTFLVIALKTQTKTTLSLALPGGALGVLGVHLQIFPINYA